MKKSTCKNIGYRRDNMFQVKDQQGKIIYTKTLLRYNKGKDSGIAIAFPDRDTVQVQPEVGPPMLVKGADCIVEKCIIADIYSSAEVIRNILYGAEQRYRKSSTPRGKGKSKQKEETISLDLGELL